MIKRIRYRASNIEGPCIGVTTFFLLRDSYVTMEILCAKACSIVCIQLFVVTDPRYNNRLQIHKTGFIKSICNGLQNLFRNEFMKLGNFLSAKSFKQVTAEGYGTTILAGSTIVDACYPTFLCCKLCTQLPETGKVLRTEVITFHGSDTESAHEVRKAGCLLLRGTAADLCNFLTSLNGRLQDRKKGKKAWHEGDDDGTVRTQKHNAQTIEPPDVRYPDVAVPSNIPVEPVAD